MRSDILQAARLAPAATQKRFLFMVLGQVVLLFALAACLNDAQTGLPTLVPTAVLSTAASPTNMPMPPPPTLVITPTVILPTNTPVISLDVIVPTDLPPTPTAADTAVANPGSNPPATSATFPVTSTVGYSVQGRPIVDYSFGSGSTHVIFVGGIHGGYEWNTILLAYEIIDYYAANPQLVPDLLTLHIIPSANPDGQFLITNQDGRFQSSDVATDSVAGRFNAHNVDLNRNWDCEWTATATWRDVEVSGGATPFSEPENIALRSFILLQNPAIVVFWHSAANGVFAAGCPEVHEPSLRYANVYGEAANYPVYEKFTSYSITGDAGDWLTLQGIPSISIELQNHESIDFSQNLNGVQALISNIAQP